MPGRKRCVFFMVPTTGACRETHWPLAQWKNHRKTMENDGKNGGKLWKPMKNGGKLWRTMESYEKRWKTMENYGNL